MKRMKLMLIALAMMAAGLGLLALAGKEKPAQPDQPPAVETSTEAQ